MATLEKIVSIVSTAFANANAETAKHKALAQQAVDELAAFKLANADAKTETLTNVLNELVAVINPQGPSDELAKAVAASPDIETPAVVAEAVEAIGNPSVETPAVVAEAAIEAVVEAIELEVAE